MCSLFTFLAPNPSDAYGQLGMGNFSGRVLNLPQQPIGYSASTGLMPSIGNAHNIVYQGSFVNYPSRCPSYPGWYGPYGHVGFPCPTCHTEIQMQPR